MTSCQTSFFLSTKYLYRYISANNVANVVASVAPAAITIVLLPDIFPIFSTIATVNNVLNICSKLCEFAVTDIFSLPLKYPFNTGSIDTKNIDGYRFTDRDFS